MWHLLPANPILVRVVAGASRRPRHLWLRAAYLGALLAVVLTSLFVSISGQSASLAELAKGASQTFKFAATTQLALMCFLAPIFTAGAITQERDAQTFNILLATPLSSAQIVFGSLMSRLYFVLVLLLAGLPIFLMTMVYGGVTSRQVFESFALSGSTALLTGALAIFIAMTRIGTRGTIFSFYLIIGLYLLSVYLLGQWSETWLEASPPNIAGKRMSWLTPLHPFLALDVALNRIYAPPAGESGGWGGLTRFALSAPSAAYVLWTSLLALGLTLGSMFFVRRSAKTGEPTWWNLLWRRGNGGAGGARKRNPRAVWHNPVAWREARTRSGGGGTVLRWTLILGGAAGLLIIFVLYLRGSLPADEVRNWLARLIAALFAIAIIIATNTAATSMTREKESRTMDILLTTPLTSKYILFGKLRGLVSFAAPLLLGPIVFLLIFGLLGLRDDPGVPAIWVETWLLLGVLMILYTACACVIGLRISLVSRKNVTAVMYSVGLIIVLFGVASMLAFAVVDSAGEDFGAFLSPFAPFTAVLYLVDPAQLYDTVKNFEQHAHEARVAAFIGSLIAALLYAFIVWSVYTGLVRNFDMIVRKQSGT